MRVVRTLGRRAVVEVAHTQLASARQAWNGPLTWPGRPAGEHPWRVCTRRSWGTLREAKLWLQARRAPSP